MHFRFSSAKVEKWKAATRCSACSRTTKSQARLQFFAWILSSTGDGMQHVFALLVVERFRHVVTQFWSLEGTAAGNIWAEPSFWNFFDVLETMGPKAQPWKNKSNEQLWNSVLWEGLRRGIYYLKEPETSLKAPLSIHLSISLSL